MCARQTEVLERDAVAVAMVVNVFQHLHANEPCGRCAPHVGVEQVCMDELNTILKDVSRQMRNDAGSGHAPHAARTFVQPQHGNAGSLELCLERPAATVGKMRLDARTIRMRYKSNCIHLSAGTAQGI